MFSFLCGIVGDWVSQWLLCRGEDASHGWYSAD